MSHEQFQKFLKEVTCIDSPSKNERKNNICRIQVFVIDITQKSYYIDQHTLHQIRKIRFTSHIVCDLVEAQKLPDKLYRKVKEENKMYCIIPGVIKDDGATMVKMVCFFFVIFNNQKVDGKNAKADDSKHKSINKLQRANTE